MDELKQIDKTEIGATIAYSSGYFNSRFTHCILICKNADMKQKYFPDKEKLTEKDVANVFNALLNKFISATDELNSLAKRNVVHRSEIEKLLNNVREAYYEYDDFAITEFDADYQRCRQCKEIILESSDILKDTCKKCDSSAFTLIIEKCGKPALEDILSAANINLELDVEEMVKEVLKNRKLCSSLIERYNKLLKEGNLIG